MNDESAVTVGCILFALGVLFAGVFLGILVIGLVITTPIALVMGFALGVLAAAFYLGVF